VRAWHLNIKNDKGALLSIPIILTSPLIFSIPQCENSDEPRSSLARSARSSEAPIGTDLYGTDHPNYECLWLAKIETKLRPNSTQLLSLLPHVRTASFNLSDGKMDKRSTGPSGLQTRSWC
jgi:hypothetical protein